MKIVETPDIQGCRYWSESIYLSSEKSADCWRNCTVKKKKKGSRENKIEFATMGSDLKPGNNDVRPT